MEQIYWSIDDFVGWRCKPDDDFWDVLATLRDQVLRGKIEITGWRCSWDQSGGNCDTDKVRQPIPVLSIEDLKFEVLPDNSDFVLIHHGSTWKSKSYELVTWTEGEYDERFGPSDRDRIHGWRELRMRADQVRAVWSAAEPAADQIAKPEERLVECSQPETHSGMPGRPTAKHLYTAELERRHAAGEMLPEVSKEAGALLSWFRAKHPSLNAGSPGTVQNNIRDRHRALRASTK